MTNALKTTLLLGLLTGLILVIGDVLGGQNGMMIALILAGVMNFVSYFFSDKIALAMYRAQPVTREELPRVYGVVERMTQRIGLPMPKIFVIPSDSPNAFATGRNPAHASVAVTQGILRLLDDEELEGVLAHELGHVRNRDILTSSIAATLAGAITMLARRPAMAIQLWVSRTREHEADATGANITHNPHALARALQKLDAYSKRIPMAASPSTAHLFIVQPLFGMNIGSLFSTHPPIYKRIERLTGRPPEYQ